MRTSGHNGPIPLRWEAGSGRAIIWNCLPPNLKVNGNIYKLLVELCLMSNAFELKPEESSVTFQGEWPPLRAPAFAALMLCCQGFLSVVKFKMMKPYAPLGFWMYTFALRLRSFGCICIFSPLCQAAGCLQQTSPWWRPRGDHGVLFLQLGLNVPLSDSFC